MTLVLSECQHFYNCLLCFLVYSLYTHSYLIACQGTLCAYECIKAMFRTFLVHSVKVDTRLQQCVRKNTRQNSLSLRWTALANCHPATLLKFWCYDQISMHITLGSQVIFKLSTAAKSWKKRLKTSATLNWT